MKLEFLADGSDCPLIRLYDFDPADAMRLREALRALSDGSRQSIPLHDEWWITTIQDCQLDLRQGKRDLGVVQRLPMRFECILTQAAWLEAMELTQPFCKTGSDDEIVRYQWLNE
ncbi:MAG TPA: hypothetical protein VMD98_05850, partial [Bryocella sp.]|nr:hypothetical protein [Bryocella sp.]